MNNNMVLSLLLLISVLLNSLFIFSSCSAGNETRRSKIEKKEPKEKSNGNAPVLSKSNVINKQATIIRSKLRRLLEIKKNDDFFSEFYNQLFENFRVSIPMPIHGKMALGKGVLLESPNNTYVLSDKYRNKDVVLNRDLQKVLFITSKGIVEEHNGWVPDKTNVLVSLKDFLFYINLKQQRIIIFNRD